MRDFFITPRKHLLENWLAAFSEARVYADAQELRDANPDEAVFWVHIDANSQQWLNATVLQIQGRVANARVVVLANVPQQAEAAFALGLGVLGYCHAYSEAAVLREVRAVVTHGGIWLGQDLLQYLIGTSRQVLTAPSNEVASALSLLTPRESEVAQQAALGLSNKEIARQLNITERTVKAHLSASFERLGLKDRLQLALILNEKSAS